MGNQEYNYKRIQKLELLLSEAYHMLKDIYGAAENLFPYTDKELAEFVPELVGKINDECHFE